MSKGCYGDGYYPYPLPFSRRTYKKNEKEYQKRKANPNYRDANSKFKFPSNDKKNR